MDDTNQNNISALNKNSNYNTNYNENIVYNNDNNDNDNNSDASLSIVSLEKIIEGDIEAVNRFKDAMYLNGWLLVSLGADINALVQTCQQELDDFFENNTNKFEYHENLLKTTTATEGAVYGYYLQPNFKEGLRLLTGGRINQKWIPGNCKHLKQLASQLDFLLYRLIVSTMDSTFKVSKETLSEHLPILKTTGSEPLQFNDSNFCMLDIARYFNQTPTTIDNNNATTPSVASHIDPGLLSLNVLSTQPGLQFSVNGKFYDCPFGNQGIGVIWAGEIASTLTNGRIKSGIHRVANVSSSPRLSIWIEACTNAQDLSNPTMNSILNSLLQGVALPQNQTARIPTTSLKNSTNTNPKIPLTSLELKPSQTLHSALLEASRQFGIPMTKSITYYCPFCLRRVHKLVSHYEEKHKDQIPIKQGQV